MNTKTNVKKLLERLGETKAETIKLGMDLHARDVVVCVQLDGALPQRLTTAQGATGWARRAYLGVAHRQRRAQRSRPIFLGTRLERRAH